MRQLRAVVYWILADDWKWYRVILFLFCFYRKMARNSISEVAVGSFTSSQNAMVEMDLSQNKIKVLPELLLDPLVKLKKL